MLSNKNNIKREICAACEEIREVIEKSFDHEISIRGDLMKFTFNLLECQTCLEKLDCPESKFNELDIAYSLYREKHNMLSSKTIEKIRKVLESTEEIEKKYRISLYDLESYAMGSLQTKKDDQILRQILQEKKLKEEQDDILKIYREKLTDMRQIEDKKSELFKMMGNFGRTGIHKSKNNIVVKLVNSKPTSTVPVVNSKPKSRVPVVNSKPKSRVPVVNSKHLPIANSKHLPIANSKSKPPIANSKPNPIVSNNTKSKTENSTSTEASEVEKKVNTEK